MNRWLLRALVVCLAVAGAACRPPTAAPLRVAHEAELPTLDPIGATDHISVSVLSNIYDALTDFDPEMRLVPALAESWTSPDSTTWIFRLRAGVRAHDGSLIEAEDVRLSIERARSAPGSSLRQLLSDLESVTVQGPREIVFRTRVPDAFLARRLVSVFIAPRSSAGMLAERPVGTGPYRFVARSEGDLAVEAFAGWRGRPSIRQVRFVTVIGNPAILAALRDQTVDVLRWVPEELVGQVAGMPRIRLVRRRSLRALYLWMRSQPVDGRRSPFQERSLRRAVVLALDRNRLIAGLAGQATPLSQLVPPGVRGHVPDLPEIGQDTEEARRQLVRAGLPEGFETTLSLHAGTLNIGTPLGEMLSTVGIRARLQVLDWPALREGWHAGRLDLFLGSWRFATGEASSFFRECLSSRPAVGESWNPGYSSERMDSLVKELLAADEEHGEELYGQLGTLGMEDLPVVPLLVREDLYAVRAGLAFEPRADGNLRVREMAPAR